MNIQTVIRHLNKKYGYNIDSTYYAQIETWLAWWRGKYKPFHEFREAKAGGGIKKRELYSLRMAKKIAEDWAAMLLNEKTEISTEDSESTTFLNAVLKDIDFARKANELVEKAFATGTGAFVLRLENAEVKPSGQIVKNPNTKIKMEYLSAEYIIPLTVKRGEIIDVAFVSEVLTGGKKLIYVETHILTPNGYEISNQYLKEQGNTLKDQPPPDNVIERMSTGSDIPLFAIIKPNICNNVADTAMGISVFANAIDQIKGVDLTYNNFNRDFKLGGKKVFLSSALVIRGEDGREITPDDVAQQLFTMVGDGIMKDGGSPIIEHNPLLRVDENVDGVQAQLDLLSFRCGLGAKFYQFNGNTKAVTATEYTGEKQDLAKNTHKHNKVLAESLKKITKSILYAGQEVCGASLALETEVSINFDDSFIRDAETERNTDIQDLREGILQRWEYRAKWYGEDEETAKANVNMSIGDDPLGFAQMSGEM